MAEIADETSSAVDLAFEMARKLREVDPHNPLLEFFTKSDDDAVWKAFQTRFGKRGATPEQHASEKGQAYVWGRYSVALKRAFLLKTDPEKVADEYIKKWRAEVAIFQDMRAALLEKYPNKDTHVALINGEEVGHGTNNVELAIEIAQKFPDDVILIAHVIPQSEEPREDMDTIES